MAVALEFFSLIIPIQNIERVYPGGFDQYKTDHATEIGKNIWYDDFLLRDCAMGWDDIETMLFEWKDRGLKLVKVADGRKEWVDLCVMYDTDGPTLRCDWIESEFFSFQANLKGVAMGRLMNRENIVEI